MSSRQGRILLDSEEGYLEWVFQFDPFTVPSGARVVLVLAEEGSPDVTYEAPSAEGRATLQAGITKYGLKNFRTLEVVAGDGTRYNLNAGLRTVFGESATVTEKEGSLAGNDCPTPILVP